MNKAIRTLRGIVNQSLGLVAPTPLSLFILCYHGFGDTSYPHNLTVSAFAKQLEYLSQHCNFVSLDDVVAYIDGRKSLKSPAVAITFDDGYASLLEVKDLVAKYNIRPTAFVLSDRERVNRQELDNQLPLLTTTQIKSLMIDGWDIDLHTATHPDLRRLPHQELVAEIARAKKTLEKNLGTSVKYFAYPKGSYSKEAIEIVKQSGFKAAFSMDDNAIAKGSDRYTISRIGINASHSLSEFPTLFTPLVQKVRKILK